MLPWVSRITLESSEEQTQGLIGVPLEGIYGIRAKKINFENIGAFFVENMVVEGERQFWLLFEKLAQIWRKVTL